MIANGVNDYPVSLKKPVNVQVSVFYVDYAGSAYEWRVYHTYTTSTGTSNSERHGHLPQCYRFGNSRQMGDGSFQFYLQMAYRTDIWIIVSFVFST